MLELVIVVAVGVVVSIVLPLLSFGRASAAVRRVEQLARRVEELEARLQASAPPPPADAPAAVRPSPLPPPSPPAEAARPVPVVPPSRPARGESLEEAIGSRWMLYVGIAAIVLGVGYFVKYAFDNRWINETARIFLGTIVGLAMVAGGHRFVRKGYTTYGQVMSGGGLVVLYVTIYAAFTFYRLVGPAAAFGMMAAITAFAAALAMKYASQPLALVAVVGGFFTPFLVGGDSDAQVTLFTYVAMLIAGTLVLARRGGWPVLNLVSCVLTAVTVAAWAARFYRPSKYLVTELFLTLFCAMFLAILRENSRSTARAARLADVVLLSAFPIYHLVSVGILFDHAAAFLVYAVAASAAGILLAFRIGDAGLRALVWLAMALPLLAWISAPTTGRPLDALAVALAVYGMHLIAQLEWLVRRREPFTKADVAIVHANGLWLYGAGYSLFASSQLAWLGLAAATLAAWHAAIGRFVRPVEREASLHFTALAFGLLCIAIAVQYDGAWVTVGWTGEAGALAWLGLRERRRWLVAAGGVLLAVTAAGLADLIGSAPAAGHVVLFNARTAAGAFYAATLYGLAALFRRTEDSALAPPRGRATLVVAANLVTLFVLTAEVNAFWLVRDRAGLAAGSVAAGFAREATWSIVWAAYAVGLIALGIRQRYAPMRYLAMVVLGGTALKVFMRDLADLERVYRILSVAVLGVLLLFASYLYQRYRSRIAES